MPTASVRLAYRPLRIGFLVRRGHVDDVVRAARLATLVWGGADDPIIAVDEDRERTGRLIAQFRVDVLQPVVDDPMLAEAVAAHPHLAWPRSVDHLGTFGPIGNSEEMLAVDVRLPISHLWNAHFSHGAASPWVWPVWKPDHELAALFSVLYGEFGPDRPAPNYLDWYVKGLLAGRLELDRGLPPRLGFERTPAGLTRLAIDEPWHGSLRSDGVVVGHPHNADHLANFWNLRTVGVDALFWPTTGAELVADAIAAHLADVAERLTRAEGPALGLHLWSCEECARPAEIPPALEALLPAGTKRVLAHLDDRTWTQPLQTPQVLAVDDVTQLAVVEEDTNSATRLVLGLPPHPFPAATLDLFHALWLVRLQLLADAGLTTHTLRLPYVPDLNPWFDWELTNGFGAVRVETEGVGVFSGPRDSSLNLRLVPRENLVAQMFARGGFETKRSAAGGATAEIIRLFGGLRECRRFRIPGVRELLRTAEWRTWQAAKQVVAAGGLTDYKGATADTMLEFLAFHGALHAGLRIQCPNCDIRHHYAATELDETVRCPRCREEFPLTPFLHDAVWHYRASGFFADRGGHGAIPVLLTMMRLEQEAIGQDRVTIPSHELRGDGINCESDLLVLERHDDGRVAVAVSESKDRMEIEQTDIDNLAAVAEKVRASGIECYLIFTTLRDSFTDDEIARFRSYRDSIAEQWSHDVAALEGWHRPGPILFTARELGKFSAYDETERARLPHQHQLGLRELAANSAALYLEAPGQTAP
jgi:hypothetical protein